MRILVTGGAGFIGSALSEKLSSEGHDVLVADLRENPAQPCVIGDLTDPSVVSRAFSGGVDAVCHLAARTSVLESKSDPQGYFRSNVEMTSHLLEACRRQGGARFLLASTNAVAGNAEHLPITEGVPLQPLTPYGATKAAAEVLCSAYSASFDTPSVALRLTNVYGPGMKLKDSFVPRLMRAAASGGQVEIYGDGSMKRDYVFLSDVVDAFAHFATAGEAAKAGTFSGAVIIGSGRSITVNELIESARTATGIDIPARRGEGRAGEMPAVVVDVSRARSLGWAPQVGMDEGMAAAWETFRP